MDYAQLERADARRASQGQIQSAGSVFAEHQILPVSEGEGLFVGAFHCGLDGSTERRFGVVDDCCQWQLVDEFVQLKVQFRNAALAVRRGENALR